MNEFSLIERFFKSRVKPRKDVFLGIGDDAACLEIPQGYHLLVSTDTLVSDVHFVSTWDAYAIAWRAVMVNISDIVAMGGESCWISLALTLPNYDESWLTRFADGFHDALARYKLCLIGGNMSAGPLNITLTIQGLVAKGRAIQRKGAVPGDRIWVSGPLGAAAEAVASIQRPKPIKKDQQQLLKILQEPKPRTDLVSLLQTYASAAIDISDGLTADLNHVCEASQVGAHLNLATIPIHPLVTKYQKDPLSVVLAGGDDYELCFTTSASKDKQALAALQTSNVRCFPIGFIEANHGLRGTMSDGTLIDLEPRGYRHF